MQRPYPAYPCEFPNFTHVRPVNASRSWAVHEPPLRVINTDWQDKQDAQGTIPALSLPIPVNPC